MDSILTASDRNAKRLQHEKALAQKDKAAVVDTKSVIKKYQWIHKAIMKLIDSPVSNYVLDYHKRHGEYLIEVLVAVRNTEAATNAIASMKANLDQYVTTTELVLKRINELPEDPLPGMNPLDLMILAADPAFAAAHDAIIDDYQKLARGNVRDILACASQGRDIYNSTNLEARKLLDELMAAQPQSDMEKTIIEANKKDIKWLILSLDKIRSTYQKAEAAQGRALRMEEFANQFVKIGSAQDG